MAFEVRALDVSAGDTRLLEAVSFALGTGEAIHLKGRSGLGKTTLLRALCALHADPGEHVSLEGATVATLGEPAWRTRCMLLAQSPTMLPGSVRENLERPFGFAAARGTFDEPRALELLSRAAVFDSPVQQWTRDAETLSGGERQRVHLVRALLLDPDVLLADEPVASLDAESADAVWTLLRDYRREGGRVLLVHHGHAPGDYTPLDLGAFACRT